MPEVKVMNKNYPIFTLQMSDTGKVEKLGEILDEKHMPIILQNNFTLKTVNYWMSSRSIPENRLGLKDVKREFQNIPAARNRFSLSDQYWFKYNTHETWSKKNYFTNRYDMNFGRMFFRPWSVKDENLKEESPDMTTGGVLKKRWIQKKDTTESSLIKMGDRQARQDSAAEVIASMILNKYKAIEHVRYELCIDGLGFCTKCSNFITEDTEFVPAAHIYRCEPRDEDRETEYEHLVRMIGKYAPGLDSEGFIDRLLFASVITMNEDIHLSNFGFIRDVESAKIVSFAPIYDCGASFFQMGEKNASQNRLFPKERVDEAVSRIIDRFGRYMIRLSYDDVMEFIDCYPLLIPDEKEELKKRIGNSLEMIKKKCAAAEHKKEEEQKAS